MRTAEINDIGFAIQTGTCHTEAELAASILNMDLEREISGWFAKNGLAIAVRTVISRRNNRQLEVSNLNITRHYFEDVSEEVFNDEVESVLPPVVIPHGQYVIGQSLALKTSKGLAVELYGSSLVASNDEREGNYERILESSQLRITKDNLPVRIGLILETSLLKIRPVVFGPQDIAL